GRRVLRGAPEGVPAGAFPPYSGGQSGTLLTTRAYVDLAESIVSVRRRRAAGTPRPAVGGRARTGRAGEDRGRTRHGSAAAGGPDSPARRSAGGPARAAPARIGGAPATGRMPGAARAVARPRLRMDAPPTRSFPVSAAAAEGRAEGSGTAVSPLCGDAVRVLPAGGGL